MIPSPRHRDQFVTTVLANSRLCRDHFRLSLGLPAVPADRAGAVRPDFLPRSRPGLQSGAGSDVGRKRQRLDTCGVELMSPLALLRRPFSLAGRRDTPAGVELDIIHRVVGVGTDWLAQLKHGDLVVILGPLGNRSACPPTGDALLVGGGVGIPADALPRRRTERGRAAGRRLLRRADARPASPDDHRQRTPPRLRRHRTAPQHRRVRPHTASRPSSRPTMDRYGFRGYVTQALERYLDAYITDMATATSRSSTPAAPSR